MKTITDKKGARATETITRTRRPSHPGALLGDIVENLGLSQGEAAEILRVGRRTVNELLNEKRGVTPEMALRLSRAFGSSPQVWLGLQNDVDLWDAQHGRQAPEIEQVRRYDQRELMAA